MLRSFIRGVWHISDTISRNTVEVQMAGRGRGQSKGRGRRPNTRSHARDTTNMNTEPRALASEVTKVLQTTLPGIFDDALRRRICWNLVVHRIQV
ncbi:hypothetical protein L1987_19103 [Smallanthus sonchifolius]|uniref:Uncharacterized protein n=1 Tax=Smallanthus sonchifolius TaxID=185202 RepID=A0ACB9J244_9ASTR|nr:hypothetical protein L1987_19103 [Smallanthus sonchifolius]